MRLALCLALAALMASCSRSTAEDTKVVWSGADLDLLASLSLGSDGLPFASPGNAHAQDDAASKLGQALFFEAGFGPGNVSCSTCHIPGCYFADHMALSKGLKLTTRHTPSVIGNQLGPFYFWDGRVDSLWAQALQPLENPNEMGATRVGVVSLIHDKYQRQYERIFGSLPDISDTSRFPPVAMPTPGNPDHPAGRAWATMTHEDREAVNQAFANVGKAIEAYEARLTPARAPFDRYVAALRSGDTTGGGHLTPAAERGLKAFIGPAGCINCHNGPLFTDHGFHNIGLEPADAENLAGKDRATLARRLDRGRAVGAWRVLANSFRSDGAYGDAASNPELEYLEPGFPDFEGAFKTPSLRNVAMTAPYGHGGQFKNLTEVIEWYRELPRVPITGHRDLVLGLFDKNVATSDLVAFLESLTGPLPDKALLGPPL